MSGHRSIFHIEDGLSSSQKPNVDAPLVELNEHGDYREALERGSRLASY